MSFTTQRVRKKDTGIITIDDNKAIDIICVYVTAKLKHQLFVSKKVKQNSKESVYLVEMSLFG
jgi:hypothetical protein